MDKKRKPIVLVIDDNKEFTDWLRPYVEELGCDVEVANSGNEGVETLIRKREQKLPVDLVVLDMELPGTRVGGSDRDEGLSVLLINASVFDLLDPTCPIIVYTAYASSQQCIKCIRAGAWDYIEKGNRDGNDVKATVKLLTKIKELLFGREKSEFEKWVEEKRPELQAQYRGQVIAIYERRALELSGMPASFFGNYGCIAFSNEKELGRAIIYNSTLRWERLFTIDFRAI